MRKRIVPYGFSLVPHCGAEASDWQDSLDSLEAVCIDFALLSEQIILTISEITRTYNVLCTYRSHWYFHLKLYC